MGSVKKAAEQKSAGVVHCPLIRNIAEHWDACDDEDRAFITEALTPSSGVTHSALKEGLATVGVAVPRVQAITEHRYGRCTCKGAPPWEM